MPPKADYRTLEHEYVTSEISIRALASKWNMSFSAVAKKARDGGWYEKRAEYRKNAVEMAMQGALERLANEAVDMKVEAVTAMRATVYQYMENLQNHKVNIGTKEAVTAIQTLQLLMGEATERKETHVVDDSIERLNPAELRELLGAVRARVVSGTTRDAGADASS